MCEEIHLYALCKTMKWAQLPEPGGLYGQNPTLLRRFKVLMSLEAEEEQKQEKKREAEERLKRPNVQNPD